MPSTPLKNLAYRAMLPFRAPSPGRKPVTEVTGQPLISPRELEGIIRRHHVLGGSVLLSDGARESRILTAALSAQTPPQPDTYYRVASITKMATAMVALILQDRGKLDLQAPVSAYLPDGSGIPELEGVTCEHLLSHRSGLSDPSGLETMLEKGTALRDALKGTRLDEAGNTFRYSNLGFGIIGCVFEAVTGLPVGKVFEDFLFRPLGMNATIEGGTLPAERIMPVVRILPFRPDQALRVTRLGSVPLRAPDPERHFGHTAGSMYTDIGSLKKMIICLRDHGMPLRQGVTRGMEQARSAYGKLSPTLHYGLGLLIIRDPRISAGRILGHQGYAYGCADGAFWEEDTGRIMIILNGGCSEARHGRLGICNEDMIKWAFRKEMNAWRG